MHELLAYCRKRGDSFDAAWDECLLVLIDEGLLD